jgi:hypothetical protein
MYDTGVSVRDICTIMAMKKLAVYKAIRTYRLDLVHNLVNFTKYVECTNQR